MSGAPEGNKNAVSVGLHTKSPAVRVIVAPDVSIAGLSVYAVDLSDAARWVAEQLADELSMDHRDAKLIGLYAAVAGEMAQIAGELQGETGIKPSPLGGLTDAQFDTMMDKQARALSLILSQCGSAWKHLQERQEIAAGIPQEDRIRLIGGEGVVVWDSDKKEWRAHPVLTHLAGHMRAAKRLMRDLAANRAWNLRGANDNDDLAARVMKAIEEMQRNGNRRD